MQEKERPTLQPTTSHGGDTGAGRRGRHRRILPRSSWRGLFAWTFPLAIVGTIYFTALPWLADRLFGVLPPPPEWVLLSLGTFLVLVPLHARIREQTRRVSLARYDVDQALLVLGQLLVSTRSVEQVATRASEMLAATLGAIGSSLWLHDGRGRFAAAVPGHSGVSSFLIPRDMLHSLQSLEILTRDDRKSSSRWAQSAWARLDAELIVPVSVGASVIACLAIGERQSGKPYDERDVGLARAAANIIGLALNTAAALEQLSSLYGDLESANERLESQVRERTSELHSTNEELAHSLRRLRAAYQQLEQSQASLLRADRLATLGRLAAGLAHEMNTPLSAVQNALKIIADLGDEYAASVDDPDVLVEDHRQIAAEITSNARSATAWAQKAAAFIRSVKAHGRDLRPVSSGSFRVGDVVAEVGELVAHRLRSFGCTLEQPSGSEPIELTGDAGQLSQVLVNLISNAVDAYEERNIAAGRIEVGAWRDRGSTFLTVRDWAGGIPAAVLPRIFEELYTTKEPGRGTGLGLWIARNIVEQGFGGTLDVVTSGEGSCFTIEIPRSPHAALAGPPAAAAASPLLVEISA
jgi:signal transduction histidine kinase